MHDITIKNIEIEIYPQNSDEKHVSSGVYSVLRNNWINKPKKFKQSIDKENILAKFSKLEKEIKLSLRDAEDKLDSSYIEKLIEKIKKMRKSGLEKSGELSDENIVYKIIRDRGYLQKLFDNKNNIIDNQLSLN
jgi:AAA+ superfamily predicted ATPase